jgi:hypothetical protein
LKRTRWLLLLRLKQLGENLHEVVPLTHARLPGDVEAETCHRFPLVGTDAVQVVVVVVEEELKLVGLMSTRSAPP